MLDKIIKGVKFNDARSERPISKYLGNFLFPLTSSIQMNYPAVSNRVSRQYPIRNAESDGESAPRDCNY